MKKFMLMIFAISIFFTGLGGIARQIGVWLGSQEIAHISIHQSEEAEEKIAFSKTIKVVRQGDKPLIVKADKGNFRFENLQINPSNQTAEPFEFERRLQIEPSRRIEEFPLRNGKNFIIIKRRNGEKIEMLETEKLQTRPVRVLIEKENKSE